MPQGESNEQVLFEFPFIAMLLFNNNFKLLTFLLYFIYLLKVINLFDYFF